MIDINKPFVDIFDDGRFIVGHYYSVSVHRHQYVGAPQLVLTYARHAQPSYRDSFHREIMPEHYGVIRDDFDGALFKQVRSMGVKLPYWLSTAKPEIIAEVTLNDAAFAMLKLAYPQ